MPPGGDVVSGATSAKTEALTGFVVVLPYPPSVNRLHRRVGARTLLSAEGRRYEEIAGLCVSLALGVASNVVPPAPHAVTLLATPPDRRRRDIDNLTKKTLDVVYRGIGMDDSVIDSLHIAWRRDGRGPCIEVQIAPQPADGRGG